MVPTWVDAGSPKATSDTWRLGNGTRATYIFFYVPQMVFLVCFPWKMK
jgi:hypothetical protein